MKIETTGGINVINLMNTYYIPKLGKNLLSMSVASANGAKILIEAGYCSIKNGKIGYWLKQSWLMVYIRSKIL